MAQTKRIASAGAANAGTPRSHKRRTFAALFPNGIGVIVAYSLDVDDWRFERWDMVLNSVSVNRSNKTVRFGFTVTGGDDAGPFQAILRDAGENWVLKADCWEESQAEYPLELFESPDSILFVFNGLRDHLYVHAEKAK